MRRRRILAVGAAGAVALGGLAASAGSAVAKTSSRHHAHRVVLRHDGTRTHALPADGTRLKAAEDGTR